MQKYTVSVEFAVETPDGVDPNTAVSAVEELCDKFSYQLSRIGPDGFRSVYGPIVRTDAVLSTRRIPEATVATEEEIEHEMDDIVPLAVIKEAIRQFLKEPTVQVTMYEPIDAVETGVWVANHHAGTWYLDGYKPDGSPNIEIGNLNSRCADED